MAGYFEVLDETDPGSVLDGDTLIHTYKMFGEYLHCHNCLAWSVRAKIL